MSNQDKWWVDTEMMEIVLGSAVLRICPGRWGIEILHSNSHTFIQSTLGLAGPERLAAFFDEVASRIRAIPPSKDNTWSWEPSDARRKEPAK